MFGLSETKTNKDLPTAKLEVEGYTYIREDRKNGEGRGVGLYIKDGIDFVRRDDLENSDMESIWVEINLTNTKPILLGNFYRPPDSSEYLPKNFNAVLANVLEKIDKSNHETIIMGDMNVNYLSKNEHSNIKNIFSDNGFKQIIDKPTRITDNTTTLIDLIQVNYKERICYKTVIPTGLSDHDLIACVRKANGVTIPPETIRYRDYRRYDPSKIMNELQNENWNDIYSKTSPNQSWNEMKRILQESLNRNAPYITKRIKGKKSPWMSKAITKHMNKRDQLFRKARKSKKESDWAVYKRKRNFVRNEIQRTKNAFFKEKLKNLADKPEKFWQTVKEIYPTKSKSTKLPTNFLSIDGSKTLTDKQSIANAFCKFFSTISNRLKKQAFPLTQISWRSPPTKVNFIKEQFSFRIVSENEVFKHLKKLNRKCAVGLDEIPSLFLKDIAPVIAKPLTHIINCSLLSGVVPDEFKQARVVPIYKSGSRKNFDNYRPISILPAISKVLEKCVHSQIMDHLESNNLLSQNQFGFRKHPSTDLATVWFSDQLRRAMDNGLLTGAIFIDLSKAFDTVGHAGIINKRPDYGITGLPLEWITNYLFSRHQHVYYNKVLSEGEPIICGVPQGSILGPLLFILYINDITTALHHAEIIKYADDTVIFFSDKDPTRIDSVLNNEFVSLKKWFEENELIINTKPGKTEAMMFGTSKRLSKLDNQPLLSILNNFETLHYTKAYKYLGLLLNETLNMSDHMKTVLKKVTSRITLLKKIRSQIDADTAKSIYNVMILPILTYSPYAINGTLSETIEKRIRINENRVKNIVQSKNITSMAFSQKKRIVKMVHKIIYENDCHNFENYFKIIDGNIQTRNHKKLVRLPKVKLQIARKSFYFQGGLEFNKLPIEIRAEKNHKKFKQKVNLYFDQFISM